MRALACACLAPLVLLAGCAVDAVDDTGRADLAASTPLAADDTDADIAERLAALPGMEVVELAAPFPDFPEYRHFVLTYTQPVDHDDPDGATFRQRARLIHRDEHHPVVIDTQGYATNPTRASLGYLPWTLDGNALAVEHRYFGGSVPDDGDPQYLTIDQAAADHHRFIQALRTIYDAAWISTGVSKGGMTATYHRRRYPDDVDGTVAFVAPLSFGRKDPRYVGFLHRVGGDALAECRAGLEELARTALARRATLAPWIVDYLAAGGDGLSWLPGGADQALDIAVGEMPFAFWQYGTPDLCDALPGSESGDAEVFDFLAGFGLFNVGSDLALVRYGPYYYQAVTELGYPRLPTAHVRDLLLHDPNDATPYVSAYGDVPDHDPWAMADMALWSLLGAKHVVFVYGELDPWTAGAYPVWPGGHNDVHRFTERGGNHGAAIPWLDEADRAAALAILERWTGVTPRLQTLAAKSLRGAGPAPWDDELPVSRLGSPRRR
jgi:hypothetical protein